MKLSLLLISALTVVACSSGGGSGGGPGGITPQGSSSAAGRVAGYAVGGGSAVAYAGYDGVGDYSMVIDIYSEAASCASNAGHQSLANQTVVSLSFDRVSPGLGQKGEPPTPGTYDVGTGYGINVGFGAQDASCDPIRLSSSLGDSLAQGGQITLTSFDGSLAAGSYEVTFATGETVSGTFSAPVCPVVTSTSGSSGGAAPACITPSP
jgi:hypothetical protein